MRPVRLASGLPLRAGLACGLVLTSCSSVLGIEIYKRQFGVADSGVESIPDGPAPRTPDSGASEAPPPMVAVSDRYSFARGSRAVIAATRGVLQNDLGLETSLATPGGFATERGGSVELAADGGFAYSPPSAEFWGDDHFSYALAVDPAIGARVRLTVQPGLILMTEVAGGTGNGFSINGVIDPEPGGLRPYVSSVSGAGDVNGDGLADLVLGAEGQAYVAFGKANGRDVALAALASGEGGFVIQAATPGDDTGPVVSSAGDVNGDGLDDVIVGSPQAPAGGAAYVVFGKRGPEPVQLANLGDSGFVILPIDPELGASALVQQVGFAVSSAGDFNADGLGDVLVGAVSEPGGVEPQTAATQSAYVVMGRTSVLPVGLSTTSGNPDSPGVAQFELPPGDQLRPKSLSEAGDYNGDGIDDVLVGSTRPNPDLGRVHLLFGRPRIEGRFLLDFLNSSDGFVLTGREGDGDLGTSGNHVAAAGDVNGDGLADLVIGASNDGSAEFTAGRAYVVFGRRGSAPFALELLAQPQAAGFAIDGVNINDFAGETVGSPGDFDGDGLSDILVGVTGSSLAALNGGAVFVVFGREQPELVSVGLLALQGSSGLAVAGTVERNAVGSRVRGAGDVNGDGLGDFIVGWEGGGYVLFGWDANDALGPRDTALIGTSADDVLEWLGEALIKAAGGNGFDTLRVPGNRVELDLRHRMPHVESIESIDLSGGGASTLWLDDNAIRRLPSPRRSPGGLVKTLIVEGDEADTVRVNLAGFEARDDLNAGRTVYRSLSGPYGLELSPTISVEAP